MLYQLSYAHHDVFVRDDCKESQEVQCKPFPGTRTRNKNAPGNSARLNPPPDGSRAQAPDRANRGSRSASRPRHGPSLPVTRKTYLITRRWLRSRPDF
ncbi:MAG: hypothetical protein KC553_01340, partial [Nitrospina sp.]|nr:hypothetical protein [Nitrospina sp.]